MSGAGAEGEWPSTGAAQKAIRFAKFAPLQVHGSSHKACPCPGAKDSPRL